MMKKFKRGPWLTIFWFPSWFPVRLFRWRSGISAQSFAILEVGRGQKSSVRQPEEPESPLLSLTVKGCSREEACSLSTLSGRSSHKRKGIILPMGEARTRALVPAFRVLFSSSS